MNEDLFGSIKQTITETAGAVGKKTEEFVETQKMRNKVRTLQREIRKKYADLGEIVYRRYVDGDTPDEELTGHCEVVMGLQKELAECKESMAVFLHFSSSFSCFCSKAINSSSLFMLNTVLSLKA